MPRALDRRKPTADYDPNRSGTEFHWNSLLKDQSEIWKDIFDQITNNATNDLAGSFFELIGTPEWLQQLFGAILDNIGLDLPGLADLSLDFSSVEAFVESLVAAMTAVGTAFLGPDSPLNALNLFNLVPTDLLAHIPISNIGTAITNHIADGDFLDGTPFEAIEDWFHDAVGGYAGTGAVSVVADGATHELLGNLIPVSPGQILPITGKIRWTALAGSGTPISLGVTGYNTAGSAVSQETVASHNTIPASTDWIDFSGTHTVPDGVASLRTRLIVGSTATAGTVDFSTIRATKTGPLLQRLVAGTDPGDLLPDDITNLFTGIVTNAVGLLDKVEQSAHDALLDVLGGDLSEIDDRLNDFLHSLSPLNADNINQGNIADQFVGGLATLNQNLFTRLWNAPHTDSTYTHDDAASALEHVRFVMMDTAARVAQMGTTFTSGVSDGDDFERSSSTSLGGGWRTSYHGGAGIWATPNGHDAAFIASGTQDRDFLCIRVSGEARSSTDLQHVALVLGSASTRYKGLLLPFDYTGHNDIWLRIADDPVAGPVIDIDNVTGIRCRFGGDGGASIDRFINGAGTTLTALPTGSLTPPGPGSHIWGEAGTPGKARYFRAGIGTSTLLYVEEVGTASGYGATFRRWGHGGRAEGHVLPLPGQEKPGNCHQFICMDQVIA